MLDVASTGSGGLVVSEWIRGGSLAEVAETSPSPIGGARAIQSLAAAAEAAHRAGVALSIDHPSRVRVSIEGDVVLAFPATLPDATPEDDIRGIGAALYALLINRWPLPESGVRSGLEPAEPRRRRSARSSRRPSTGTSPSRSRRPRARAVQEEGGIRSAPTLLEPAAAGHRGRRSHRASSRPWTNPTGRSRRRGRGAPRDRSGGAGAPPQGA